jgi:hypothetical protein
MELTQGSETSAYQKLTPGKYPKEHTQYSRHGESLKSSKTWDLFSEQPYETKLSQLIQKITLFKSIINLAYLCTAKLSLLSCLFTVRCCAVTLSLLKLVHRYYSTEQTILKFLPLLTTAQL